MHVVLKKKADANPGNANAVQKILLKRKNNNYIFFPVAKPIARLTASSADFA